MTNDGMTDDRTAVRARRTVRVLLSFVILHSSFVVPAPAVAGQPPFFEPKEHYYKARGVGVAVGWSVDRTEVPEDESIVATLTVRNVDNPREVVRPDLRQLAEFKDRFQIDDVSKPSVVTANPKEVAFVYRLRPRNREVDRLPSLEFAYLNPTIKN